MGGVEPAGGIAELAERHAIKAPQVGWLLRIDMVNTEPVVPGFDPNHQGVAEQLSAINAVALLPGKTTIDGKQPRSGCSAPRLKIRKSQECLHQFAPTDSVPVDRGR